MQTTLEAKPEVSQESRIEPRKATPKSEADYLQMAADRRERRGEPVTALLFRNEAYRLALSESGEGMEN